jgi:hypothetical protein
MAAFHFRSRRTRRLWKFAVTLAALTAFATIFVAGSSAILSGSTFEGSDGNLIVDTPGNTDWANAPNLHVGVDLPTGQTDNSFGQGTQENDVNVSVLTGSIPNSKADLARFAVASEFVNGSNFLYLAWTRENLSGTVNFDFEINQKTQPDLTTPGPKTLVRTAGDLLINYSFQGGSNTPTLTLRKWTGSVWGAEQALTGSSEGATNSAPVNDTLGGNPSVSRPAQAFGEAAVNLTAAGVFPPGTCEAFGSAFVKSRASTSFTSEIKDFIAPVAVNITNCGTITIHKVTENGDASFGYTTTGGLNPATFSLSNGGTRTYGPGTVFAGNYSVTESTLPAGWTFKSLVCTATGQGTSVSTSTVTASITMGGGGVVDCTYTNHTNAGPTITTTLSANPVPVGSTVHDSATLSGATANAGGTVTYTVYTDSGCSQGAQDAGTVTVTNGVVPDSNAITFNSAGDFFWQAVYSGDGNNSGTSSACTSEHLVVQKLSPSIATTLSDSSVPVGATVHDSATLSGATVTAGGTVTYTVYTDSNCSQNAQSAGTKTVTNGVVPDSDPITFNTAGDFFWQAVYSGDGNNNGASSDCTSEHLVVNKANPSIATTLSATSISIGQSVTDSAALTGATANAGGTVTYTVYTNSSCSAGAQDAGTKTVVNGVVPDSNPITFNSAGDFFWQAVYSGDANNNGASSACTSEHMIVNKNQPSASTAQTLLPNDSFTLSGATLNATGSITFNLYAPGDTTCSGAPALTQTVNVLGNGTYATTNNSFFASAEGTWRWQSSYSGDANNGSVSSPCGTERFTIANS